MKKKGFTLIELLAVIVILAIIVIIAVVKIGNVIEEAKKETYRSTNKIIINQVGKLNGVELVPQTYTFTNGVSSPDLQLSGEMPTNGTVEINENGEIQLATNNSKFCAIKRFNESEVAVYDVGNRLCNIVQEVTLTINPNGGIYAGVTSNTTYGILPNGTQNVENPIRDGYIFTGWNLTCTSCLANKVYTMSEEEDILTAQWLAYSNMYTYSGTSTVINDGNGNWRIKFLTSGTFIPVIDMEIDAFLVGGGAGGINNGSQPGGGGGGGHTTNAIYQVVKNTSYTITIGAGGGIGSSGGTTTAFTLSANGGSAGSGYVGGAGGSGGGGAHNNYGTAGSGGSNGTAGGSASASGGTGQGNTTREFHGITGDLYGGGGGGGSYGSTPGSGGLGGGGRGGSSTTGAAIVGTANTGGGGGGNGNGVAASAGGSGIVIIRNRKIEEVGDTNKFSFSYSGSYLVLDRNTDDWRVKFLTNGAFIPLSTISIDAFLVGGGAGGINNTSNQPGGGGGGGRTNKITYQVTENTAYNIIIGAGGLAGMNGNASSAFGYAAAGGSVGSGYAGGAGGSGGGGAHNNNGIAGVGGSDGAAGTSASASGGSGQGTTTREFHETTGDLYSGGGGGGNYSAVPGNGGAGGGGRGGSAGSYPSIAGTQNTGGGGGGGGGCGILASGGGSGIVIIRAN